MNRRSLRCRRFWLLRINIGGNQRRSGNTELHQLDRPNLIRIERGNDSTDREQHDVPDGRAHISPDGEMRGVVDQRGEVDSQQCHQQRKQCAPSTNPKSCRGIHKNPPTVANIDDTTTSFLLCKQMRRPAANRLLRACRYGVSPVACAEAWRDRAARGTPVSCRPTCKPTVPPPFAL